jgi:uncharacterized membrane protein
MWNMHDGFGWWALVGSAWMVLFWAAIVWLVVSLASRGRQTDEPAGNPLPATEIAAQRYARGEISRDEFARMIDDLRNPGAAGQGGTP